MARVSHVALPMITLFPRDSHLLFTSSPRFFLSRLYSFPKPGRHNFAFVKLETGSSYVVSSPSFRVESEKRDLIIDASLRFTVQRRWQSK